MGSSIKVSELILTLLVASTLLLVPLTNAQTIPAPSSPEFTVRYVDYSYDVPPKYGIDQYTGNNVTVQAGYHVDNRSIEFTIKNQQFTPYTDSNGNNIQLYYNFRYKGNYGDDWTYYPLDSNGRSVFHYGGIFVEVTPTAYVASNSDYSVLELSLNLLGSGYGQTPPNGVEVNFEVQALIGYFSYDQYGYFNFSGKLSDWSTAQTITIGETSSPSTSPTPSPSPTVPEISWLAILLFLLATPLIALIRLRKKRS